MSNLTITYSTKKRKRHRKDLPPIGSNKLKLDFTVSSDKCYFCRSSHQSEEECGKFIKKCGLTVHYFCMLFSSGLSQNGKTDSQGIFGFLPVDLRRELNRGNRLRCSYCREKGATVGCVVAACRKVFHFVCGRKEGSLHQFYDNFRSFCAEHRPLQSVQTSNRLAFKGTANTVCSICMQAVVARSTPDTLRTPCCKNSWFHRLCIQRYAMSAGLYFFKCPLCNSKELFQSEMLQFGIYIPDQDAAWESEPNAYQSLYERYSHCDAVKCMCPQGRSHSTDTAKWEMLVCEFCGSCGSHQHCHGLKRVKGRNLCLQCDEVNKRAKSKPKKQVIVREPTLAEIQCMLKDRVARVVLERHDIVGSSVNLTQHKYSEPALGRSRPLICSRSESSKSESSDVDVVGDDSDDEVQLFPKRHKLSMLRQLNRPTHRSCTVTSNIEMESSKTTCSTSITTTSSLNGKYSNYVTVSTIHDRDINGWTSVKRHEQPSTSCSTVSMSEYTPLRSGGGRQEDDFDEDTLFNDLSNSSSSESDTCSAVDEGDTTEKMVTIKWNGQKIKIHNQVENDKNDNISKWSLHLQVGESEKPSDVNDNCTIAVKPREPEVEKYDTISVEDSPPRLVPIEEEVFFRSTDTVSTDPTPVGMFSSRRGALIQQQIPGMSETMKTVSRVTRSMSFDGGYMTQVESKKDFTLPWIVTRDVDCDSVRSAANSVITVSSNVSDVDEVESDCLIVEPAVVDNKPNIDNLWVSRSSRLSTDSNSARLQPANMVIDLTDWTTEVLGSPTS